jgi:hypothetical protein
MRLRWIKMYIILKITPSFIRDSDEFNVQMITIFVIFIKKYYRIYCNNYYTNINNINVNINDELIIKIFIKRHIYFFEIAIELPLSVSSYKNCGVVRGKQVGKIHTI